MENNMENENVQVSENYQTDIANLLVGYARRSEAGKAIKLSINTNAFGDCSTYTTSDGQTYVPLVISMSAIRKVIDGDRVVTTVCQLILE